MYRTQRFHHRRSMRLKGHHYAKAGKYFVTLNCRNREHIFGEIKNGKMYLNDFGLIALNEWKRTAIIRQHVELGEFVIMPDHIHGIIIFTKDLNFISQSFLSPSQTLGAIIRGYMGTVTSQINKMRNTPDEKIWQRNYYDHIIRNKWSFHRISNYIRSNPKKWLGSKD